MLRLFRSVAPLAVLATVLLLGMDSLAGVGESQTNLNDIHPVVPGRLMRAYQGIDRTGHGFTGYCEFDALVTVSDGRIDKVIKAGENHTPSVNDAVAVPNEEARPGVTGEVPGQNVVSIYRAGDGTLKPGCAPESIIERDGERRPLGEVFPRPN